MKKIKSNYWQNRSAKFLVSQLEISEKAIRRMNPVYNESYKYLQEQGRSVFEAYLRKQSFTEAEARRIVSRVNDFTNINDIKKAMLRSTDSKAMKEIVKEMDSAPFAFRINRLMEMSNDIDSVSKRISKAQLGATANALSEIAKNGYRYKLSEIDDMVGFNVSSGFSDLDQEYVDKLMSSNWNGSNYSKRIWKSGNKLSKSLKEEFLVNYLTGRSNAQMAEKLAERFGVSLFDARRIVRTEATYIQGEVDAKAYEDTGVSEYEFVAVLDSRTSKICNELDGKKFQVKDRQAGTNYPPMHPFCRSTTIAVIDVDKMYNNALTNYRIRNNEKMIRSSVNEEESSNKGLFRNLRINRSIINSNAYDKKFEKIDSDKKITRKIKSSARDMLRHRDGTFFEDLAFINSETGEVMVSDNYEVEQKAKVTKSMKSMIKSTKPQSIIAVHNHPESSPPSYSDIYACEVRKYKYGIVVSHNGDIWKYEVGKDFSDVGYRVAFVKFERSRYNDIKDFIENCAKAGVKLWKI